MTLPLTTILLLFCQCKWPSVFTEKYIKLAGNYLTAEYVQESSLLTGKKRILNDGDILILTIPFANVFWALFKHDVGFLNLV